MKFTVIAGPCQLESYKHAEMIAEHVGSVCDYLGFQYVFKASFDKANRTSINGVRGIGMEKSLEIFQALKDRLGVAVTTDVHECHQVEEVGKVVDIIQIPALLSRQTDLILEAAKTGKTVSVKKGQFMAPSDTKNIVDKIQSVGNDKAILIERGTSFGYNNLVVDMTGIPIMRKWAPVIFDATHSVQKPGGNGTSSSGNRDLVPYLARAATAVGISGLFIETHEDPDNAPSDGPNMVRLDGIRKLLTDCKKIHSIINLN